MLEEIGEGGGERGGGASHAQLQTLISLLATLNRQETHGRGVNAVKGILQRSRPSLGGPLGDPRGQRGHVSGQWRGGRKGEGR